PARGRLVQHKEFWFVLWILPAPQFAQPMCHNAALCPGPAQHSPKPVEDVHADFCLDGSPQFTTAEQRKFKRVIFLHAAESNPAQLKKFSRAHVPILLSKSASDIYGWKSRFPCPSHR